MSSNATGTMAAQVKSTSAALQAAGFEVVGTYQPYAAATVISVTNAALKTAAAKTDFGGYGAVVRVAVTQAGDKVQVSYVNPAWMSASFKMAADLTAVDKQLAKALGGASAYGAQDPGWKADQLDEFHFTVFMPYFDDPLELAEHASYDAAIKAVEAGLAAGKGGTAKVFRVDIPGKKQTLFGVSLTKAAGVAGDEHIMALIDGRDMKQTAHLPYSVLVSEGNVYALHAKFSIANAFPDLDMSTFFKINDAPDAIEASLKQAAGGE
ncbi:MAG: hypothetical protein KAT25_07750 [Sulfuriflexus sp.]|nr:hypothetical protein [Sulfuriflexus sp.]